MPSLASLSARFILDSRGNPTVEVDCVLDDGSFGRAAVPSGASTGVHEALELRDNDAECYGGKSVFTAVRNVEERIVPIVQGMEVHNQREIDQRMIEHDGTDNKASLGANAILGVSMAVCRARAAAEGLSLWESLAQQFDVAEPHLLPTPMMNVLNGGKHADSGLAFQEFMIVPSDFPSFSRALQAGAEIFHTLKGILSKEGMVTAVGDEGGFAPRLPDNKTACEMLMRAIDDAGYTGHVHLALDAAASEFFQDAVYHADGTTFDSAALVSYYKELADAFPLVSIEDSHAEDDWDGFVAMHSALGDRVQLVGDDLLVTNVQRMHEAIEKSAANSVLVKVNQIGSVSEAVDAIQLAQQHDWTAVVSHRSGETEDTFIAHLAVGLRAGQIKTGSLSRSDRVCKYNELLRIEEELGERATYGGKMGPK